jgi:hypothetical protein
MSGRCDAVFSQEEKLALLQITSQSYDPTPNNIYARGQRGKLVAKLSIESLNTEP